MLKALLVADGGARRQAGPWRRRPHQAAEGAVSVEMPLRRPRPCRPTPRPRRRAQASGGIQGQNIFEVKPEIKPTRPDPGYMQQTNGERTGSARQQRADVARGRPRHQGYSSLPKSRRPRRAC